MMRVRKKARLFVQEKLQSATNAVAPDHEVRVYWRTRRETMIVKP
jgi:hypothetical protein